MSVSYYELTIPVFIKHFENLTNILKKTEKFAKEKGKSDEEIMSLRIAPDMMPFTFQVQIMIGLCINMIHFGAGLEKPEYSAGEKTFADFYASIDHAISFLKATPSTLFDDGKLDGKVRFWYPGSQVMEIGGKAFILDYIIPNFFFHSTTAYDLVRAIGVPIGKTDFLGETVTYLGPGPETDASH